MNGPPLAESSPGVWFNGKFEGQRAAGPGRVALGLCTWHVWVEPKPYKRVGLHFKNANGSVLGRNYIGFEN